MAIDQLDRHEENKIEAQALKNEWVDRAVTQQLKDGDYADEMFRAMESLAHNELHMNSLLKYARLPTIDRYRHLGMVLYARLEIECENTQEAKYDPELNNKRLR